MHCCCTEGAAPAVLTPPASSKRKPPSSTTSAAWSGRIATLIRWSIPLTALALMPKCPACVAAYVLLFTGIGLSLAAATVVRWALIAISIAALVYLLFRAGRRTALQTLVKGSCRT